MENTNLTNEVMEQENEIMVYDLPEEEVVTGSGFGTKALVGAVVIGAVGFVGKKVADKLKPKFEEARAARKAKKNEKAAEELRKAGYFVAKEEDCEVYQTEVEDEEVVETTEE